MSQWLPKINSLVMGKLQTLKKSVSSIYKVTFNPDCFFVLHYQMSHWGMEEFVVQHTWKLFLITNQYRKLHTEKPYLNTDTHRNLVKLVLPCHFSLPRHRHFLAPPSIRCINTASDGNPKGCSTPSHWTWERTFLKLSALVTIQLVYERKPGPCSKISVQYQTGL